MTKRATSKRTPEQVHDSGGHKSPVDACTKCQTEAEHDRNTEQVRADLAALNETNPSLGHPVDPDVVLGETGGRETGPDEAPLPAADPPGYPADAEQLPAERLQYVNGRVKCYVDSCPLPEFDEKKGLCGGHWTLRPDLRKVARRA